MTNDQFDALVNLIESLIYHALCQHEHGSHSIARRAYAVDQARWALVDESNT